MTAIGGSLIRAAERILRRSNRWSARVGSRSRPGRPGQRRLGRSGGLAPVGAWG